MSADRLRAAATLLRERTEAATPGPWDFQRWTDYTLPSGEYGESILLANAAPDGEIAREIGNEDGAYIATVDPTVALAVADFLDEMGRLHEHGDSGGPLIHRRALAIADAILAGGAS